MARFLDGPVEGRELSIRRCPFFLRVVTDETTGEVDALDRLDDTPGPSERIHVYRRIEDTWSRAIVDYRGKQKHLSGWYEFADYAYVGPVDDALVRETNAWRLWCYETAQAEGIAA